jgi:hypothetical protein
LPVPQQQPLNYRLQSPAQYMPSSASPNYPPDDVLPYDVDLFDQTLGASLSAENVYVTPREMWLESMVISTSEGSDANPPVAFQVQATYLDDNGEVETIIVAQQNPVPSPVKFGTAQQPAVLSKKMQYFAPGTEISCQVSNLQSSSNEVQIVLRMYMRNLPNIPTQVGH